MAGSDEFIDPKIVRKDLDEVEKQARLVVLYANKIVAHRTAESVVVTLRHVNDSLETIEKVLQKYYLLLTASSLLGAEPVDHKSLATCFHGAMDPLGIGRGRTRLNTTPNVVFINVLGFAKQVLQGRSINVRHT